MRPVVRYDLVEFRYHAIDFYPDIKEFNLLYPSNDEHRAKEDEFKFLIVLGDIKRAFHNLGLVSYKSAIYGVPGFGQYSNVVWNNMTDKFTLQGNEALLTDGQVKGQVTFTVTVPAKNSSSVDTNLVKTVDFVITPSSAKINVD